MKPSVLRVCENDPMETARRILTLDHARNDEARVTENRSAVVRAGAPGCCDVQGAMGQGTGISTCTQPRGALC